MIMRMTASPRKLCSLVGNGLSGTLGGTGQPFQVACDCQNETVNDARYLTAESFPPAPERDNVPKTHRTLWTSKVYHIRHRRSQEVLRSAAALFTTPKGRQQLLLPVQVEGRRSCPKVGRNQASVGQPWSITHAGNGPHIHESERLNVTLK